VSGAPSLVERFGSRREGAKLLIPYLMAGAEEDWAETIEAVIGAGADAVEVGLPFSDPIIDGPTIEDAGNRSLARGTTAHSVLATLAGRTWGAPLVVMTYYNVIAHMGHERFAGLAAEAGVSGAIIPDLSLEEIDGWADTADGEGIATVMLVAPSTSPERTVRICDRSRGFVYAVARMGVTGERAEIGDEASAVVAKVSAATSLPACVGIGVSNPEQAKQVSRVADGVVVGSALVRRLSEGAGPDGAAAFVASLREAIDS
jgi:tryptophan synthase alpha chain